MGREWYGSRWVAPRSLVGPGCASLAACGVVLLASLAYPEASLSAWLVALVFWSSLPLGALLLLLMMRVVPGAWYRELGHQTETLVLGLPLAALATIPLLVGLGHFYGIVAAGLVSQGDDIAFRTHYLNPAFLVLRDIGFFALAIFAAYRLLRDGQAAKVIALSGLIAFPLFDSLIAVDWLMSLDPHFHTSGFGLYLLSIQATIGLSTLILMRLHMSRTTVRAMEEGEDKAPAEKGKAPGLLSGLLLTALLLGVYFSFMQYIITWSGNLPQGVIWFQRRSAGGWGIYEYAIFLPQGIAIALLLFRPLRSSVFWLSFAGVCSLLGKLLEIIWLVMPAIGGPLLPTLLLAVLAFAALGVTFGIFLVVAARYGRKAFPILRRPGEATS